MKKQQRPRSEGTRGVMVGEPRPSDCTATPPTLTDQPEAPELADTLAKLTAILPGLKAAIESKPRGEPPLAYRKAAAARMCGMSQRTLERLLSAGKFPRPDAYAGKCPLWTRATLERWLADGGGRDMIPTPRQAWILDRLLYDRQPPLNGEIATISEPWRSIATCPDATPGDRLKLWDGFLLGQPDPDAIILAMAESFPMGPPPRPVRMTTEADDGLGTDPPRRRCPRPNRSLLTSLPIPARDLAEAAAESIGCPVDFPAVAILAAASGIIGRSARLVIKPGYFESASLYAAPCGEPFKRQITSPARPWPPSGKSSREYDDSGDRRWMRGRPPSPTRGEEPSLTPDRHDRPHNRGPRPDPGQEPDAGLIVVPDEMTKWVMSMDQYKGGKGGDRPFYLSAWNGEPVYIDRAKHMTEPIVVPHPFLTVVGGMTPDMLSTLPEGRGRDDGFIARLLFAYPDRMAHRLLRARHPG